MLRLQRPPTNRALPTQNGTAAPTLSQWPAAGATALSHVTKHTHARTCTQSNPPGDVSENLSCTGAGFGDFEIAGDDGK
jgi:hypothetical protein